MDLPAVVINCIYIIIMGAVALVERWGRFKVEEENKKLKRKIEEMTDGYV